eukprot:TRINITY_DN696_c0_g1_i1.p1 TRINITY_DN696_c0_g1~~TRINITY_DN696_c0_g1_i1.p1  ORF type:complete len:623 (+),score=85.22 TRINITY_DN696_c0_g1_i1:52-1869(+)
MAEAPAGPAPAAAALPPAPAAVGPASAAAAAAAFPPAPAAVGQAPDAVPPSAAGPAHFDPARLPSVRPAQRATEDPWPMPPQEWLWVCTGCGTGNEPGTGLRCRKCSQINASSDTVPKCDDHLRVMWSTDATVCEGCGAEFVGSGLSSGRHHCRDCGGLVCSKCSEPKRKKCSGYGTLPRRVCKMCEKVWLQNNVIMKVRAASKGCEHRAVVTMADFWLRARYPRGALLVDVHEDAQLQLQLAVLPPKIDGPEVKCVPSLRSLTMAVEQRMSLSGWKRQAVKPHCDVKLPARLRMRVLWSGGAEQEQVRTHLLIAELVSDVLQASFPDAIDMADPARVTAFRCSCCQISWWLKGAQARTRCQFCSKPRDVPSAIWALAGYEPAETAFLALQYSVGDSFETMQPVYPSLGESTVCIDTPGFLRMRERLRVFVTGRAQEAAVMQRDIQQDAHREIQMSRRTHDLSILRMCLEAEDRQRAQLHDLERLCCDSLLENLRTELAVIARAQSPPQRPCVGESQATCPICMDRPLDVTLGCGHTYCKYCVRDIVVQAVQAVEAVEAVRDLPTGEQLTLEALSDAVTKHAGAARCSFCDEALTKVQVCFIQTA